MTITGKICAANQDATLGACRDTKIIYRTGNSRTIDATICLSSILDLISPLRLTIMLREFWSEIANFILILINETDFSAIRWLWVNSRTVTPCSQIGLPQRLYCCSQIRAKTGRTLPSIGRRARAGDIGLAACTHLHRVMLKDRHRDRKMGVRCPVGSVQWRPHWQRVMLPTSATLVKSTRMCGSSPFACSQSDCE